LNSLFTQNELFENKIDLEMRIEAKAKQLGVDLYTSNDSAGNFAEQFTNSM
jgi:hypothetical protein